MPRLLFLAQFAPENGTLNVQPKDEEEIFYANTYHKKIYDILKKNECEFYSTNNVDYLIKNHNDFDLVWSLYNRLHFRNSEIFVQSLCEYYNLKYIGAAPNIRAIIEDKQLSKMVANQLEIPTAKWIVASKLIKIPNKAPFLGPYFVKPRFGSASIGIDESCICYQWDSVKEKALSYISMGQEVIIEEFIDGIYYGVPVMNSFDGTPIVAKPHFQISNKSGNVITYSQKRFTEKGMQRFLSEDNKINDLLSDMTEKYFKAIQPCDYARIDFMIDRLTGKPYFLEVNALMNLGVYGGFVESFLNSGFESYESLICHILQLGFLKCEHSLDKACNKKN